mgnify:CR=1 FL=1
MIYFKTVNEDNKLEINIYSLFSVFVQKSNITANWLTLSFVIQVE